MLMLTKRARSHPKETLDSIPGDLRASNSYSGLDRPDSKSTENVGNLHSKLNIKELVHSNVDLNGDTTRLTRDHGHATLSSIEAQSIQVIKVQGILYGSPPSQYTAKYRAELKCNRETKI